MTVEDVSNINGVVFIVLGWTQPVFAVQSIAGR